MLWKKLQSAEATNRGPPIAHCKSKIANYRYKFAADFASKKLCVSATAVFLSSFFFVTYYQRDSSVWIRGEGQK
jgi:hypothetical protein